MLKAAAARRLATTEPAKSAELLPGAGAQRCHGNHRRSRFGGRVAPAGAGRPRPGRGLQDYVDSVQTPSGPRLQFTFDGVADLGQLPESVEVAAYRIATEALTNVLRHAHADSASIALWIDHEQLQMKITDDGMARTPWSAGIGLSSLRERASALGGRMSAGPY